MFKTVAEIRAAFIKDGWDSGTDFDELTMEEAEKHGYTFAMRGLRQGRKFFRMKGSGNIFNDRGKVVMYNVKGCLHG